MLTRVRERVRFWATRAMVQWEHLSDETAPSLASGRGPRPAEAALEDTAKPRHTRHLAGEDLYDLAILIFGFAIDRC